MPEITHCQCKCGYTCGGPGKCSLKPLDCLDAGHFVRNCHHDFAGMVTFRDPVTGVSGGSAACSRCGILAIEHDMWVGP